jgi:putative endonuclease
MTDNTEIGIRGEKDALEILKSKGHKLLEKNWRSGHLEIDIITLFEDEVIFTEVKARQSNYFGEPVTFVNRTKQKMIIKAANHFMTKYYPHHEARFDIIGITYIENQKLINHIENAFYPY